MAAARVRSRWTDLHPDLLGLVLSRVLSHADRVRLRAVCRAWRSGARTVQHLLPPLPPLAALRDGSFLSLPDGAIHRMPIPEDVFHRVCTGGMLFLVHHDDRCSLMHPGSGDVTPQEIRPTTIWYRLTVPTRTSAEEVRKVVVADHFVAVRTLKSVRVYARGGAESTGVEWVAPEYCSPESADMALFQGKLYVLTVKKEDREYGLYALDIAGSAEEGGISVVASVPCISGTKIPRDRTSSFYRQHRFYLVVSGDRLLMVEHTINRWPDGARAPSEFLVLEAADLNGQAPGWSKVDTLMGHALFVSEGCSESLSLPVGVTVSGGAHEDCIYFMSEAYANGYNYSYYMELECGVYNMRQGTVESPLPPFNMMAETTLEGPWPPTWLFPVGT
uniref:Uncharacterized protein n=1 Tax=Avena sativa TaxID=4498 RepID=A0ACD5TI15_AVESA